MSAYTEKDFENFSNNPEQLKHWISLCKEYIATRPSHSCGFCFWTTHVKDTPFGYVAGCGYTRMYTSNTTVIISRACGPVPERIAFVEWMLKQSKKDLEQLSNI